MIRWARRHRVRLIPQGANTGLVGASTPPALSDAVVLSLSRLRRPPTIDPADRTAVVDAGVLLSELNGAAEPHGLSLPIDLGSDPSLGGMVATNTGGARMLRHGDMRAAVLGVRAVLADDDCTVLDELTTLRKHNVGPAMSQLLVGSGGALGVVTQVAVSLTTLSEDRACAWIVPTSDAAAVECLHVLERRCAGELSAFEVLSAEALDAALAVALGGDAAVRSRGVAAAQRAGRARGGRRRRGPPGRRARRAARRRTARRRGGHASRRRVVGAPRRDRGTGPPGDGARFRRVGAATGAGRPDRVGTRSDDNGASAGPSSPTSATGAMAGCTATSASPTPQDVRTRPATRNAGSHGRWCWAWWWTGSGAASAPSTVSAPPTPTGGDGPPPRGRVRCSAAVAERADPLGILGHPDLPYRDP